MLWAIIFWYSLRWRRSSAGSLGGSHDGRVRERTASFSLEMGKGSIMIFDRRRGGSSAKADFTRGFTSGSEDLLAFGIEPVLDRCCTLCSICSACSSNFSVSALASALKSANAAVQLLARDMTGLATRLDAAELMVESADSDFQVGDRSEPCATATAGVPFPTLRTRSLGARSGDGVLDGGRLCDRSDGGRGEIGTLSSTSPSGISSPSSSSHSISSSTAVLRSRFDCQLLLRGFIIKFGSLGASDRLGLGLRRPLRDVWDFWRPRVRNGRGLE
jgi:outer membrane murein-binding lipoprotein Lpp